MWRILAALTAFLLLATSPEAQETPVQDLLAQNRDLISESSRRTIGPAIDAIAESGLPEAQVVLQKWQNREMWLRESDGMFFWAEEIDRDTLRIFDFDTGDDLGEVPDDDFDQIKPNSGIRALIGAALVRFQLTDPNPARRRDGARRGHSPLPPRAPHARPTPGQARARRASHPRVGPRGSGRTRAVVPDPARPRTVRGVRR